MPTFEYTHRVRYRECDPMGVVYHAHFIDYFEYARTEALREMGVTYKGVEESGVIMPVVDLDVRYLQPAKYDDVLTVATTFPNQVPTVRIPISYEIRRLGDPGVLVSGSVTLCFVRKATGRPIGAPASIVRAFERALEPV